MSLAVEMRGIGKRFGDVVALERVDLSVEKGTIHAVVGENGAGKTTLMRILYGAASPDSGTILVQGEGKRYRNSAEAIQNGIGMVSQHYSILPELTNLQNLMLGAEPGWMIRQADAIKRADELAERMGFEFDWNANAALLSPGGAQKLEILKLLWRDAKIMILDEPTAMLSPADSDALFASLGKLVAQGATVILVTHRLPEVISHCKTVTVLRGGRLVGSEPVSRVGTEKLTELIVGHAVAPPTLEKLPVGKVRLKLDGVSAKGYRGDLALRGIDLELQAGELLGLAGVDGNGQRELVRVLTGDLRPSSGRIIWDDGDITDSPVARRLAQGFRLIPEDRHDEAIIDGWPLEENAALGLQRLAPFAKGKGGVATIDLSGRKSAAKTITELLGTKHGGLGQPISSLSGGNQQRFVAGRALYLEPQLLLAFQPARGLDIDATSRLYQLVRERCRKGACAIVVSFDLDEILEQCDRVAVMCGGILTFPRPGSERDRNEIGKLMVGAG